MPTPIARPKRLWAGNPPTQPNDIVWTGHNPFKREEQWRLYYLHPNPAKPGGKNLSLYKLCAVEPVVGKGNYHLTWNRGTSTWLQSARGDGIVLCLSHRPRLAATVTRHVRYHQGLDRAESEFQGKIPEEFADILS